jgi:hypothetical protein
MSERISGNEVKGEDLCLHRVYCFPCARSEFRKFTQMLTLKVILILGSRHFIMINLSELLPRLFFNFFRLLWKISWSTKVPNEVYKYRSTWKLCAVATSLKLTSTFLTCNVIWPRKHAASFGMTLPLCKAHVMLSAVRFITKNSDTSCLKYTP